MQLFPLIQTDTPSQHWSNPSTVVDPAISFAAAFELLASPITRNELELSALEPKEPTSETEEPIDSQSQENPAQPEDQAFSDIEMAPPVATHLHVREPKEAVESKAAFPSQASLGMQLSANATLGAAKTASTRGSDSISPNVETTLPARAFVAGTSSITHANPAIAQSETAIKNSKEDATGTQATTLGLVRSSANPISAIIAAGLRPLAQSTQGITLTDAQVNNLTLSPSQASHSTPRDATGAHFQQTNIPPVQPASGLEPSAEVQMRVEISQASTTATRASQRLQPDTHAHNPLLMQLLNKPTASTPQTAEQITSGTSTPPSEEHTAPPHRGTVAALQQTTAPLDAHARRERHFDIHQVEKARSTSTAFRTNRAIPVAPSQAQIQSRITGSPSQPGGVLAELHSTEPDQILLAAESRLSSTHSASANVAPTMPAPQHLHATVAKQIADTLKTSSDRSIELTLSPAELGRVRMSLSTTDAGVSIIIHAERPETLDLMRRNIGELDREFTDMGYTDVDFAFSGGDGAQDQPDNPSGKGSGTTAPESPIVATHSDERQGALLSPDSAMDLRI